MSVTFVSRHPLEDHISGFETKPNPNHLSILRRPAVVSVLAHAGHETAVLAALSGLGDASARFAGPGEWLLVSETAGADSLIRDLAAAGPEKLSAFDQSEGRVVLRISGPSVRRILAKCVAVDLHPDAFVVRQSANVLCCHVSANLACVAPDAFEITVMRSFTGTVFEELMEMGREFALTAGFAS